MRRRKPCNRRPISRLPAERWETFCKYLAEKKKPRRNLLSRKNWLPKRAILRKESPCFIQITVRRDPKEMCKQPRPRRAILGQSVSRNCREAQPGRRPPAI